MNAIEPRASNYSTYDTGQSSIQYGSPDKLGLNSADSSLNAVNGQPAINDGLYRILPYPYPRQDPLAGLQNALTQMMQSIMQPIMQLFAKMLSIFEQMVKAFSGMTEKAPANDPTSTGPNATSPSGTSGTTPTPTDTSTPGTGSTDATADGSVPNTTVGDPGKCGCPKKPTKETAVKTKAPKGFLWKPISDSNKKLVILAPKNLSKDIKSINILDPEGKKTIGIGEYKGIANGDRAHFRFKFAGSHYPPGCIVEIKTNHGETVRIRIPKPDKRVE